MFIIIKYGDITQIQNREQYVQYALAFIGKLCKAALPPLEKQMAWVIAAIIFIGGIICFTWLV
jgi:hypothetical protein